VQMPDGVDAWGGSWLWRRHHCCSHQIGRHGRAGPTVPPRPTMAHSQLGQHKHPSRRGPIPIWAIQHLQRKGMGWVFVQVQRNPSYPIRLWYSPLGLYMVW
jgi:hypothetical protein